jgi:hypothetical protein
MKYLNRFLVQVGCPPAKSGDLTPGHPTKPTKPPREAPKFSVHAPETPGKTGETSGRPFTWDELKTWRWGPAIGDPTPGIVRTTPLTARSRRPTE